MSSFLDKIGLEYFWGKIKSFVSDATVDKTRSIPFGVVDNTSTATAFTATVDGITELRDGVCMYLMNGVITSASGFTININNLGAKPVYQTLAAATRGTTIFNINYTMLFVYNSTRVSGGCWDIFYGYNSDTNTIAYNVRRNSGNMKTITACGRYQFLFTYDESHVLPTHTTSNSTNTSKTLTSLEFDPFGAIHYYAYTTAISAEGTFGVTYLYVQHSSCDLRYAFNVSDSVNTLTANTAVYLKCTPQTNGKVKLASTSNPLTQTLPSSADGLMYIYLGRAYSGYQMQLDSVHPVYMYVNGVVREISQDAMTVNGHSVNADVPSDAVFTDTTYSDVVADGASGLMTGSDKTKLNGIATGAEVNQNAFSNVKVGSTTVAADSETDTLELVAGSNITLTPDATNDKVTINATNMRIIPSGSTDASSSATAFVAIVDGITALSDGVSLYLKNTKIDSAENCTLNINSLGAKPIYLYGATGTEKRVKKEFTLNSTMYFIYNATRVSGGCWEMFFFQGVSDLPIFEGNYNTTTGEMTFTCNKTYEECLDLERENNRGAIFNGYTNDVLDGQDVFSVSTIESNYIIYTPFGSWGDIKYNSDGTIEYTSPSSTVVSPSAPIATKGTVDNHSISVTPSVTFSSGWIQESGTTTGVPVTVSASELVSGTLTINSSGTKDVTNYASVSVGAGTEGTPTATKGTVSSHSITVTPSVTNTAGYISGGTKTGTGVTVSASELVSGTKSISANGTDIDVTNYESVDVSVPTGTARTSSDITVSGATVTVPAGLYSSEATKSVASGTAGTPTASKGTVSNHAITVTPTVTNTTGYITGGTKTGTGVSVSASELVNGTLAIDSSGTKDVTNYASASVAAGSAGTPSASKGTVSNHSVAITPSVTNTTGFITGSTKTGTAVTVSASELVSGNLAITDNGTGIDVTNYATVSVDVESSGGSSGYTLTTVAAQQTVTPTSNGTYYNATLSMTTGLEADSEYIITFNGTEYYFTCQVLWGTNYLLGDVNYFYGTTGLPYPFGIIWMSGNTATLAVGSGDSVTIKIEKLELTSSGSSAGYVWQDEDGYIHLSDEESIQTVVEPLSVIQNGTYTAQSGHAYSPVIVNVPSGGGGGGASKKDINFYDYDGTLLHSYTAAEALALTALPENPSHSGLTAQGWNWSLSDMKAQVTAIGACDIGQMYITDDGLTHIYVHFEEGRSSPYFGIGVNGTVEVDWGDGSSTSTLTGTSLTTVKTEQHIYAPGDYVIKLKVVSGSFTFFGVSSTSHILKKSTETSSNISRVYTNAVQKIELGSGVTSIGTYAFYYCHSLASITIPSGVTSIGSNAFQYCYSLASLTIPSGVTSIGSNAFYNCYTLASLTIPSGVTSIGGYAFYNCHSLASVTILSGVTSIGTGAFQYCFSLASFIIPSGVTSIGTNAFYNCYGMVEYHLLPTTPPTLANTNAFTNIQSDCIIYVPQGCLGAYQTAENWSTYASYMQEEA